MDNNRLKPIKIMDSAALLGDILIPSTTPELPKDAPNLETAAAWAQDGINSAFAKGFIPEDLQNNYKSNITRAEFCRMAVRFVEYKLEKNIDEVLADNNKSRNPAAFSDTQDEDILAAYALGITGGTKAPTETAPGTFSPDGPFPREQAAGMIMNVCKVLGMETRNSPTAGFTDIDKASPWAVNGIDFCYANEIMGGTSKTALVFNPKGTYTRQESICTFDKLK